MWLLQMWLETLIRKNLEIMIYEVSRENKMKREDEWTVILREKGEVTVYIKCM